MAPRPLQLQAGEGDGLITPEDRDAIVSTVQRAYCQMDAESNFSYVLHPDGHLLRFELAEQFLKRHL